MLIYPTRLHYRVYRCSRVGGHGSAAGFLERNVSGSERLEGGLVVNRIVPAVGLLNAGPHSVAKFLITSPP
jgi:hypothetical protein